MPTIDHAKFEQIAETETPFDSFESEGTRYSLHRFETPIDGYVGMVTSVDLTDGYATFACRRHAANLKYEWETIQQQTLARAVIRVANNWPIRQ